jgi:hypothetical protein
LVTRFAALLTVLRVGTTDFLAELFRFALARRGADLRAALFFELDFFIADFLPPDFFAADFLAAVLRPPLFFAAARFGALARFALFLRAGDLRAEDLRPLFFLAPPRDDFLAAAMLRAPM